MIICICVSLSSLLTLSSLSSLLLKVFAACLDAQKSKAYFEQTLTSEQMKHVMVVPLDVTSDKSCKNAANIVDAWIATNASKGLYAIVQYHGIAFNGPASYMPIDMYL